MQVEARMRLEPALDRRSLVGGVVVDDQMQIEIRQGFLVDALEEPQEFPLPVSGHAFADDRAVKHIQGCEQRGCAMALVVVGHGTGTPLLHRQARLGTIERLDLAHMGICESRCSDQKSIVNPRSLLRIQGLSPFA